MHRYWPLLDLVVTTPRLELRVVDDSSALGLVELASRGVHDPDSMPFEVPWTLEPDGVRQRHSLQHYWRTRANFTAEAWGVEFAVFESGELVGAQMLRARDFPRLRVAATGSWLGIEHHGRGIGKEMRRAVLHLAFEGLGARRCESAAFEDNPASQAVSRALGYSDNGDEMTLRMGVPARKLRFKIERERWEQTRTDDVVVTGLEPCLELFGLSE